MRSRRAGVSVVIVYRQSMCVACTDSTVTGRDACTGRFVRIPCTDSAVTGRDACTGRFVRICIACTDSAVTWSYVIGRLVRVCICLLVLGCCVSLRGAWLSLYE